MKARISSVPQCGKGTTKIIRNQPKFLLQNFARRSYCSSVPNQQKPISKDAELTVVLLGWLGCTPKRLRRYAEFYQTYFHKHPKLNILTFIPPMYSVIIPSQASRLAAKFAEQELNHKHTSTDQTIIFHQFSGNGPHFYAHLLTYLHNNNNTRLLSQIRGCILDSGPPVHLDVDIVTRGFVAAILGLRRQLRKRFDKLLPTARGKEQRAKKSPPAVSHTLNLDTQELDAEPEHAATAQYEHWLLTPVIRLIAKIYLSTPSIRKNIANVIAASVHKQVCIWEDYSKIPKPKIPQLFIYSPNDPLFPVILLQQSILHMQKHGFPVDELCLPDSGHVRGFLDHPQAYKRAIIQWLGKYDIVPENIVKELHELATKEHETSMKNKK